MDNFSSLVRVAITLDHMRASAPHFFEASDVRVGLSVLLCSATHFCYKVAHRISRSVSSVTYLWFDPAHGDKAAFLTATKRAKRRRPRCAAWDVVNGHCRRACLNNSESSEELLSLQEIVKASALRGWP